MALPTSTNEVTTRRLSAVISGLWNKIKTLLAGKSDITEGVYYVVGTHDYSAWVANHAYAVNDTVNYSNQIKVCKTAHTSGSTYDSSKWNNLGTPVLKGTIDGVTTLYTGIKIAYRWPCYGGSSSTYLNINGLGNVYVRRNNGNLTTHLPIGSVSFLAYDGTYWQWADYDSNTNNWVTTMGAYCDTAAATAAKVASSTNTVLTAGMSFLIRIVNANTSAGKLTLNINSQGAKDIWINGAVSSSSNYTLPAGEHWCHYDGSVFHIWTDGTAHFKQLKLTNKLTDANISSASTWNAKQDALSTQTAYSAKGTATKVPQITTNSLGQVTGITEVTITGVTPASHSHGNIANGGTLTDTAAAAAGNDYVVIRDADNAKIQTSTIKGTDVADAVSKKHSHSTLTLSTTAQTYDGSHTLALPSTDPYTSARTPTSHTHGNITNGGALQTNDVTIANGDKLVVTDASDSNKVARTSVSFDGSTTTKALTQKGTFESFAKSSDIPAAVSVKGNAESSYRTGQVNLTPANLGISATTSSVTVGSTTFNNTDTKVKATAKTDNVNYKILATASASPTSGNATEAVYDTDITLNPSTNTIAANISGTATTAAGYTSDGAIATALGNKVDKVSGKGLSTNDFTNTYKSNVDSNTNARHSHSNKSVLDGISANNLVYDCGTGSTSTTDFDNALAAFNAGKWVIIHKGTLPYYCVGSYSGPGLRFKSFADETQLLKVYTLIWTRGSAPTAGTNLEAALVGHTHSNYVPITRKINGKTLDVDINLSASDVGAVTSSKSASQGSNETSLVTRGEKYYWNNKQDALSSTWDPASGQTFGIALDEGGIDQSLKNIAISPNAMTSDTYLLVHDFVGETSYWKARHINKLWDWVKSKIASVLNLYTRDNDTPYFNGLAANAVQAIKATDANITRTADTTNGDKLQIGTGTAVNITNAGRANYADGAGYATSSGTAYSADIATKAEQDATGATLAPLVVKYQTGSISDVFNQLTTAYVSKRRIFCIYGLEVAGSTDNAEIKIPLSSVRFDSNNTIESFEFVTSHISRGVSSADIAGQIMVITANHLANGSYNWGIEYQWPYAASMAEVTSRLATPRKTYVTLGTASTSTTRDWSGDTTIPVDGTLNISNGGTGATSAHAAFKNLTNESFDGASSLAKHFIMIDDAWNRVGHASIATVKSVLGLGDAAYKDVGTGSSQVAAGNHTHDSRYDSRYLRILTDSTASAYFDFDNAKTRGIHFINASNSQHTSDNPGPYSGNLVLFVLANATGTRVFQIAIGSTLAIQFRRWTGSEWTTWKVLSMS